MPLDSILSQLESEQLIRSVVEADPTYIFKNVLSQQAAYQSLLTKNRRELHRCVAQAYEKFYSDQLDEIAALLAQHYREAGDDAKTLDFSIRAGNAAMRVFANAEALAFYARAVEVVRTSPHAVEQNTALGELYLKRGRVFELSGNYDEALKNYEEMETLGHARGNPTMELDAIIALATIRSTPTTVYDATLGQSLSDWGIQVAQKAGNREAEAKILWNLMNLCFFTMRPKEGIEYGERALALARELGLTERLAYILNDINRLYLALGETAQARKCVAEARELWRVLNNLPMLADNYGSGAEIAQYSGQLDLTFAEAEQAVEIAISIDNPWTLSYAQGAQAFVLLERGEMDRAFHVALESIRNAEQAGFAAGLGVGKSELGLALANLGLVARGIEMVQEVLDSPAAGAFETFRPLILAYLVRLYARAGRLDQAEGLAKEIQEKISPDHPFIYIAAPIGLAFGELAFEKKDYAGAIDALESVLNKNRRQKLRFLYADALVLQGCAFQAMGELDRAEQVFAEARTQAESENARRVLWQIYLGLDRIARARGNEANANEWRRRARAIVVFIADHLSDKTLRDSFLNLPDVREVMG